MVWYGTVWHGSVLLVKSSRAKKEFERESPRNDPLKSNPRSTPGSNRVLLYLLFID